MLPPVTAWLARPRDPRTRAGTLSVERGSLTFAARDGERIRVAGEWVERVRRHRGTPVMEMRYRRRETSRVLLLYFAEPPPMTDRLSLPRSGARGMGRIAAIRRLRAVNRRLKPVIEEWVRAVEGTRGG